MKIKTLVALLFLTHSTLLPFGSAEYFFEQKEMLDQNPAATLHVYRCYQNLLDDTRDAIRQVQIGDECTVLHTLARDIALQQQKVLSRASLAQRLKIMAYRLRLPLGLACIVGGLGGCLWYLTRSTTPTKRAAAQAVKDYHQEKIENFQPDDYEARLIIFNTLLSHKDEIDTAFSSRMELAQEDSMDSEEEEHFAYFKSLIPKSKATRKKILDLLAIISFSSEAVTVKNVMQVSQALKELKMLSPHIEKYISSIRDFSNPIHGCSLDTYADRDSRADFSANLMAQICLLKLVARQRPGLQERAQAVIDWMQGHLIAYSINQNLHIRVSDLSEYEEMLFPVDAYASALSYNFYREKLDLFFDSGLRLLELFKRFVEQNQQLPQEQAFEAGLCNMSRYSAYFERLCDRGKFSSTSGDEVLKFLGVPFRPCDSLRFLAQNTYFEQPYEYDSPQLWEEFQIPG